MRFAGSLSIEVIPWDATAAPAAIQRREFSLPPLGSQTEWEQDLPGLLNPLNLRAKGGLVPLITLHTLLCKLCYGRVKPLHAQWCLHPHECCQGEQPHACCVQMPSFASRLQQIQMTKQHRRQLEVAPPASSPARSAGCRSSSMQPCATRNCRLPTSAKSLENRQVGRAPAAVLFHSHERR